MGRRKAGIVLLGQIGATPALIKKRNVPMPPKMKPSVESMSAEELIDEAVGLLAKLERVLASNAKQQRGGKGRHIWLVW
jgi:hypothetical protein